MNSLDGMQPRPRLSGNRCRCTACGEYFNSVSAFDRHRLGSYQNRGGQRRCRTWRELRSLGWAVSAAGFWIERPRIDNPPPRADPSVVVEPHWREPKQ